MVSYPFHRQEAKSWKVNYFANVTWVASGRVKAYAKLVWSKVIFRSPNVHWKRGYAGGREIGEEGPVSRDYWPSPWNSSTVINVEGTRAIVNRALYHPLGWDCASCLTDTHSSLLTRDLETSVRICFHPLFEDRDLFNAPCINWYIKLTVCFAHALIHNMALGCLLSLRTSIKTKRERS